MTVASIAPTTAHWNTTTNSRSSRMFTADAASMAYRGVCESPKARTIAARPLYMKVNISPALPMTRYCTAMS